MKTSYIYIITDGDDFKVGVSVEPKKRIKQLQTGSSKKLSLVKTFKLPAEKVYSLEKEAHKEIQSLFTKRGEWFKGASLFHINMIVDMVCEKDIVE